MSFPHISSCEWVEKAKPDNLDTHKDATIDSELAWQTFLFACDNCEMTRSRCHCNGASKFVRLLMYDRNRIDGKYHNETYFNLLTANAASEAAKMTESAVAGSSVVATDVANATEVIAPEPKLQTDQGLFDMFVPYDENDNQHRLHHGNVTVYNDWALIRRHLAAVENEKQEARLRTEGHYSIGVVKTNGGVHEAYWPSIDTTDACEQKWLRRAADLKVQYDYIEALEADWPEIQPLDGELSPVPAFDSAWLPLAIRPHMESLAERMSVPIDFTAVGAICTLAGCVGRRALVYPKANDKSWFEPITISGAVIADSGKKKTPTWKALMRPLYELEKDWESEYEKRVAEHMKARAAYAKAVKDAEKAKTDCTLPEPVEPSKSLRLVLNDSTPEKMHDICKNNPQGLFFERDELSGLVAELDMVGRESMRSFFLDGMTGDSSKTVDRIGREGGQADLTFTVFGSFQPLMFCNAISDAKNVSSGMIPRFHALIWPDKSSLPRLDKAENQEAFQRYRKIIRTFASMKDKSVFLHFAKDAQQLFYDFQEWLDGFMNAETNPGKQSHLSKLEGGTAKIAALFQLIDMVQDLPPVSSHSVNLETGLEEVVAKSGVPVGNVYIDQEHFQMAWNFVRYLVKHMHRVYDAKQEGLERLKMRLVEHIEDGTLRDGMTARDIHVKDWAGLSRKVTSADSIEAALEEMVEFGWVRLIPVKPGTAGPGRPTRRWEVNPSARK